MISKRHWLQSLFALMLVVGWSQTAQAEEANNRKVVRVGVFVDSGAGRSRKDLLRVLKTIPRFQVTTLKTADIVGGKLKDVDVIIHPGGSGGKQGRTLGTEGRKVVRDFVKNGGGYLGLCAGAYLATNDYKWSLNILDAKVLDKKHWARGYGRVQLRMTAEGKRLLGVKTDEITIYYHQGPLLVPNNDPKTPDYRPLARFETEVKKKGVPDGVMKGTAAVVAGKFGNGRVFCFSPHPEKTIGLEQLVERAILWAANRRMSD